MRKINEVGNKYGRLTVIEEAGHNKNGKILWKCICDCGKEAVISGALLRNGKTKSCGCFSSEVSRKLCKDRALPLGQACFNTLYGNYKNQAQRRELPFELTKEDFSFLTQMNCYYCGIVPKQTINKKRQNGPYIYNGIDRIDSNKGYTLDNVVPCCGVCNRMKMDMNSFEFKEHIRKIYEHRVQTTKELRGNNGSYT